MVDVCHACVRVTMTRRVRSSKHLIMVNFPHPVCKKISGKKFRSSGVENLDCDAAAGGRCCGADRIANTCVQ